MKIVHLEGQTISRDKRDSNVDCRADRSTVEGSRPSVPTGHTPQGQKKSPRSLTNLENSTMGHFPAKGTPAQRMKPHDCVSECTIDGNFLYNISFQYPAQQICQIINQQCLTLGIKILVKCNACDARNAIGLVALACRASKAARSP